MGQGSVSVQIWTVPWVCSAGRLLPQRGRYPLCGPVLASAPAATLELHDEIWDVFVARALAAVDLAGCEEDYVVLDTQARYVELGPRLGARSARENCASLALPAGMLRTRVKELGADRGGLVGALSGTRAAQTLAGGTSIFDGFGTQIAALEGVARLLVVPRAQPLLVPESIATGGGAFLWLKAFAPELKLLGGIMLPTDCTLGGGGRAEVRRLRDYVTADGMASFVGDEEIEWWREDVSVRALCRVRPDRPIRQLGLRSGNVMIAHRAASERSCHELYASSASQLRQTPEANLSQPQRSNARGVELPIHHFSASGDGNSSCQICLEAFRPGDALRANPCAHMFHAHCLDAWLARSVSCPICRHAV
mmetsp:Transcript_95721/g.270904  ORF Transcript_95721/g.270904 Transcript_95721/m.270904 type:complete len:366 (-) Transcript_95721:34-1131(-)